VARGGSGDKATLLAARPYVASSPGSPLPHLFDGHRDIVASSAIPASSCPGPVRYPWGSIVEFEVPPDEMPGLMTLHPHNTNILQSTTYATSPYPPDRSNSGQKTNAFDTSMASPSSQHNLYNECLSWIHRHCCRVWSLLPETAMKSTLLVRVWALPPSLGARRSIKVH